MKYKEEFEKLNVNNSSKAMVYITCANYIDELEEQTEKRLKCLRWIMQNLDDGTIRTQLTIDTIKAIMNEK